MSRRHDDDELARRLNLPAESLAKMDPRKRATYEFLLDMADALVAWQLKLEQKPPGVITLSRPRRSPRR